LASLLVLTVAVCEKGHLDSPPPMNYSVFYMSGALPFMPKPQFFSDFFPSLSPVLCNLTRRDARKFSSWLSEFPFFGAVHEHVIRGRVPARSSFFNLGPPFSPVRVWVDPSGQRKVQGCVYIPVTAPLLPFSFWVCLVYFPRPEKSKR